MLGTDYKHLTVKILQAIHKFLAIVLKSKYTGFLLGPPNDYAPTTNPDGLKDCLRISPSSSYPLKKYIHQTKGNYT